MLLIKKKNSYIATTNLRTFKKILEIYNKNIENLSLEFFFEGSRYAIITKKNNNNLLEEEKIIFKKRNLKNFIKNFYLKLPKS